MTAFDAAAYEERVRAGCFVCAFLAGESSSNTGR